MTVRTPAALLMAFALATAVAVAMVAASQHATRSTATAHAFGGPRAANCSSVTIRGRAETPDLRLTGSIDHVSFSAGHAARLVFTLTNRRSTPISLSFANACQVTPYIVDCATGVTLYPTKEWACAMMMTSLDLVPRGTFERVVELPLQDAPDVASAPGVYAAYARLWNTTIGTVAVSDLRSDLIVFTVTP